MTLRTKLLGKEAGIVFLKFATKDCAYVSWLESQTLMPLAMFWFNWTYSLGIDVV